MRKQTGTKKVRVRAYDFEGVQTQSGKARVEVWRTGSSTDPWTLIPPRRYSEDADQIRETLSRNLAEAPQPGNPHIGDCFLVRNIDSVRFLRVCLGLTRNSRLNFYVGLANADSGPDARALREPVTRHPLGFRFLLRAKEKIMPGLDTPLHITMYQRWKKRSLPTRLRKAIQIVLGKQDIYGLQWADPDSNPPLAYIRDHYLFPYIGPETVAVEIGPGGGRWTRYMKGVKKLYAIDYHQELLDELSRTVHWHNISFIKNNGDDFPGIPATSIDLVFSFGVFVHLDVGIIDRYLKNIWPLLRREANVIIQYSDKTKPLARLHSGFAQNDPTTMRKLVTDNGYSIYEEDIQTLWHSSVIRFGVRAV